MNRDEQGSKAGRRERHLARQARMKERKRLRKARAARFAHLPGQQASHGSDRVAPKIGGGKRPLPALDNLPVGTLREIAKDAGCEVRSRHRKAELIAMIQDKHEART